MKWRILVVDDEPDVRAVIKATLQPKYEVVEAQDGLAALEMLERTEPDFVLMDVMMPLMDGFGSCATIRKNERFSKLPVMFLTALGDRESIKKGYGAGANLYLTKPFEPSRLLKNIDVFFDTTPPPRIKKRFTMDQLEALTTIASPSKDDVSPAAIAETAPIPQAPEWAPKPPPAMSPSELLPRVMVVDDDPDVHTLVEGNLRGIAEVVSASDGIEAIERLVKYQPDVLILDIMMPKMSGYQLCQSLRSNRAFAKLPILVCSAKGGQRDQQFAQRVGADDFLTKPFTAEEMAAKIRGLLARTGFAIRPKVYAIRQIHEFEGKTAKADVFQADAETRHSAPSNFVEGSSKAINSFLKREGEKDGTKREEPGTTHEDPEEPKRKRRLFGFGKK